MIESDRLKQGEGFASRRNVIHRTEKNQTDFTYTPVFIYSMNWLIAIQGHRRAGSLSQHALSERQGNTLDRAPVYHRANKETGITPMGIQSLKIDVKLQVFGLWEETRGNPREHGKNTPPPHRAEAPSNFLL